MSEINLGKFKNQWHKIIADIEKAAPVAAKKLLTFDEAKNFGMGKWKSHRQTPYPASH